MKIIDQIIHDLNEKGWSHHSDVLGVDTLLCLNQFINQKYSEFRPAKVGPRDNKIRQIEIRGDHTLWIDPIDPPVELDYNIHFLQQLRSKINARLFLGLKEFECHLAYYPPGTWYKKHSDRFEKNSSRILSFIFYINQEWEPEDGGELVIYHNDGTLLKIIPPLPGSFVCFISEDFPHEVRMAKKERRSLTGWMHTEIIY